MARVINKNEAVSVAFTAQDLRELMILLAYRGSDSSDEVKLRKVWKEVVKDWMK